MLRTIGGALLATFVIAGCTTTSSPGTGAATSATATKAPASSATAPAPGLTATAPAATGQAQPTAAAAQPPAKPSPATSAPSAEGVQLTVNGQLVQLQGEVKAARGDAFTLMIRAGNGDGSKPGYGAALDLQAKPETGLPEGFAVNAVEFVTFTVYKERDLSYISAGRAPGQPVRGLKLDQTKDRLKGSYEENVSGAILGKFPAKIEFDLPFPK